MDIYKGDERRKLLHPRWPLDLWLVSCSFKNVGGKFKNIYIYMKRVALFRTESTVRNENESRLLIV